MQILLVSDLHYTLKQLDWVTSVAGEYDLVVVAGDHLDIASSVPLDAQTVVATRFMAELARSTIVVCCSGNHDLTGRDGNGERSALWMADVAAAGVHHDGDSVLIDGTLITVCAWWDGPIGREKVAAQLAADAARAADRWVWVYHWPPAGSRTTWTGHKHYGDADLLAWIEQHQPDVVLAGHVHESPFKPDGSWADRIGRTWVFNAGRQIGPEPTSVLIDLAAGTATWRSMLGVEEVRLDADPPRERPALA